MKLRKQRGAAFAMALLVLTTIMVLAVYLMDTKKENLAALNKATVAERETQTEKSLNGQAEDGGRQAADGTAKNGVDEQGQADDGVQKAVGSQETYKDQQEKIFEIHEITDEVFARIKGKSYKEDCDVPRKDLRYLCLSYYGFDEKTHLGEIIVNAAIAEDTVNVFRELYEVSYPIERMELVDEYGADDIASMEANNTSAFNFRYIDGTKKYSNHARGFAIDINPLYNPYVREKNGEEDVLPVTAKAYADRKADCTYYIERDDICYQIFTKYGFSWGGEWKNSKDYQHFEKIVQ